MENEINIKKIMKAMLILLLTSVVVGGCTLKKDNEKKVPSTSTTQKNEADSTQNTDESTSTATSATDSTAEKATESTETTAANKNNDSKVTVKNGISYVDGVMIVNKSYSLPSNYNPGCSAEADEAYYRMKAAAKEDGVSFFVVSDFRSYQTQESIYNRYVSEDGKAAADRYSARPGHSEHQTGLAYDLNSLSTSFGETTEGEWLADHCWEYGFIIRYPEGKESITGYMYEPWHVRYLGEKTAKAVHESGLTLEEYLGIDSVYSD